MDRFKMGCLVVMGLGLSGRAYADAPHLSLVTSRSPVSPGMGMTVAGAVSESTRWGFASLEGGMPVYDRGHGGGIGLNLRVPTSIVQVPDEGRQHLSLRTVDLELWFYGRELDTGSYRAAGVAGGMASRSAQTVFMDTTDFGVALWTFYQSHRDGDGFDIDFAVRTGLHSYSVIFADVSAVVQIEATDSVALSMGALSGFPQPLWLILGAAWSPDSNADLSAGCALPILQDEDTMLCRPYLQIDFRPR